MLILMIFWPVIACAIISGIVALLRYLKFKNKFHSVITFVLGTSFGAGFSFYVNILILIICGPMALWATSFADFLDVYIFVFLLFIPGSLVFYVPLYLYTHRTFLLIRDEEKTVSEKKTRLLNCLALHFLPNILSCCLTVLMFLV